MNWEFVLVILMITDLAKSSSKVKGKIKEKYTKLPEIYSYEDTTRNQVVSDMDSFEMVEEYSEQGHDHLKGSSSAQNDLESYLSIATSGAEHLEWKTLPETELPIVEKTEFTAQYTTINVPLFYGMDAEKYGIGDESFKRSFFSIYLRKYHWGRINRLEPVRHVILVAGGPGESAQSWIRKLNKLSRKYDRNNLIFYIADHRGIYKSRDVVELVKRETGRGGGRDKTSWRKVRRNERVDEMSWVKNVPEFEKDIGYPLVAMTCSNAARDLGIISLVIRNKMQINSRDKLYIHAQSYGTQVTIRTLNILPELYEAVLLEGLATMELVKESAKADFGILSSCAEDRHCSRMFLRPQVDHDPNLLPLRSPFDLRNLLEAMSLKTHNRVCRDIFQNQMKSYVYSESVSFWDAVHLSFYELLADDFLNPFTGPEGNFYPGMLVLPLIRDMYYCEDVERFRRQVNKIVEVIATSIRGLKQPYVKTSPSKSKPVDAKKATSFFVQSYINAHEAYDMREMGQSHEKAYCAKPNQRDLINQCPIWREQVRKIDRLKQLSSERRSNRPIDKKRVVLDRFEGKDKGHDDSSSSSSTSSSSKTSDSSEEGESSSDVDTSDSGEFYKSVLKTIKSFTLDKVKNKTKRRGNVKSKQVDKDTCDLDTTLDTEFDLDTTCDTEFDLDTTLDTEDVQISKSHKIKTTNHFLLKRYYYDVDDLAYQVPVSSKTKIFVTVGSLDIKTPILEARRLLSRIQAPFKTLFELKNVAHSTEPCRGEIIQAFMAADSERLRTAMATAEACINELDKRRKLDWDLRGVLNIPREDWII